MKRFVFLMFTLCLSAAFLMNSCKDPEPEPTPSPYDQVLTKDGIYLSIYAFNNGIVSKMDYTLIDNQSSDLIQNWIRNLQNNEDATALLYTIDSSLNTLNRTQFPKSLSSLHMVNFTDGIDNASVYFSNSQWGTHYANRNEYQTALKNRLRNGTFHGLSMSAFGVGVQSASIDPVVFNSTIQDISSSDDKARVLANFASVNQEFEQIANSISSTTTVTDVTFSFTCGGSDRIAFVFDGAATPALSTCKIEATLNANNTLSDIEYTGLTSSSAATITGQQITGVGRQHLCTGCGVQPAITNLHADTDQDRWYHPRAGCQQLVGQQLRERTGGRLQLRADSGRFAKEETLICHQQEI